MDNTILLKRISDTGKNVRKHASLHICDVLWEAHDEIVRLNKELETTQKWLDEFQSKYAEEVLKNAIRN